MGILSFSEAKNDPSKIIAAELTSGSLLDGGNAGGATFNNNGAIADSPNLPVSWSISAPDQALLESSFYFTFALQVIGCTNGSNPIADGVLIQFNGGAFTSVGGDFFFNFPSKNGDANEITINSKPDSHLLFVARYDGTDTTIWVDYLPIARFTGIDFTDFFNIFEACNNSVGSKSNGGVRIKDVALLSDAQALKNSGLRVLEIGESHAGRSGNSPQFFNPALTAYSGNQIPVYQKSLTYSLDGLTEQGGGTSGGDWGNGVGYNGGEPNDTPHNLFNTTVGVNMDAGGDNEFFRELGRAGHYFLTEKSVFNYAKSGCTISAANGTNGMIEQFAAFENNPDAAIINVMKIIIGTNDCLGTNPRALRTVGSGSNSLANFQTFLDNVGASPKVAKGTKILISKVVTTQNSTAANTAEQINRDAITQLNADYDTLQQYCDDNAIDLNIVVAETFAFFGGFFGFLLEDFVTNDLHRSNDLGYTKEGKFLGQTLNEEMSMDFLIGFKDLAASIVETVNSTTTVAANDSGAYISVGDADTINTASAMVVQQAGARTFRIMLYEHDGVEPGAFVSTLGEVVSSFASPGSPELVEITGLSFVLPKVGQGYTVSAQMVSPSSAGSLAYSGAATGNPQRTGAAAYTPPDPFAETDKDAPNVAVWLDGVATDLGGSRNLKAYKQARQSNSGLNQGVNYKTKGAGPSGAGRNAKAPLKGIH